MTKLTITSVLVLVVFALFYNTNTSLANKAAFGFTITGQYSFNLTDLDGASSVRIEVRIDTSGSSYQTITGLGSITSTGSYTRSSGQLSAQFGYGNFLCRVNDNSQFNHFSQDVQLTITP